jgi:uncharacterized membrane protein YkgB
MRQFHIGLVRADRQFTTWVAEHGVTVLRISVGIVFFWFGVLKFFPTLSPAEDLAARTIAALSFGIVKPAVSVPVLAAWECLIGLSLITGQFVRVALLTMFGHMLGTITPLILFPHETWTRVPYAATLEGQYILKNMVLVSAALVVYASVHARDLADDQVRSAEMRLTPLAVGGFQRVDR